MKCNKNPVLSKCCTWEQWKSNSLNSLELRNRNVNFRKLELIGGLSDQQRQLLCWTDAVFASLGLRSSGLFRRLSLAVLLISLTVTLPPTLGLWSSLAGDSGQTGGFHWLQQVTKHIEACTKWLPFWRWHFQMHILNRKFMYLDWNFNEDCS